MTIYIWNKCLVYKRDIPGIALSSMSIVHSILIPAQTDFPNAWSIIYPQRSPTFFFMRDNPDGQYFPLVQSSRRQQQIFTNNKKNNLWRLEIPQCNKRIILGKILPYKRFVYFNAGIVFLSSNLIKMGIRILFLFLH